jgi:hypothetical protein
VTIRDGKVDIALPNVNGAGRCDEPGARKSRECPNLALHSIRRRYLLLKP